MSGNVTSRFDSALANIAYHEAESQGYVEEGACCKTPSKIEGFLTTISLGLIPTARSFYNAHVYENYHAKAEELATQQPNQLAYGCTARLFKAMATERKWVARSQLLMSMGAILAIGFVVLTILGGLDPSKAHLFTHAELNNAAYTGLGLFGAGLIGFNVTKSWCLFKQSALQTDYQQLEAVAKPSKVK